MERCLLRAQLRIIMSPKFCFVIFTYRHLFSVNVLFATQCANEYTNEEYFWKLSLEGKILKGGALNLLVKTDFIAFIYLLRLS